MKTIILAIMMSSSIFAQATLTRISETEIKIPHPTKFVAITPEMKALTQLINRLQDPGNKLIIAFISEDDALIALKNELPPLDRPMYIQIPNSLLNKQLSSPEFELYKNMLKTKKSDEINKLEQKISGYLVNINANLKNIKVNKKFNEINVIPLPFHYESENIISCSMFIKSKIDEGSGKFYTDLMTGTVTSVNVMGKIINLYCMGGEDDLEWTRTAGKQWAESILLANPQGMSKSSPSWKASISPRVGAKLLGIAGSALALCLVVWVWNIKK